MEIQQLKRVFVYNGINLADPGAALDPAAVKEFYGATYPELVNAEIEGPVRKDNADTYAFRKAVGTKGAEHPMHKHLNALMRYAEKDSDPVSAFVVEGASTSDDRTVLVIKGSKESKFAMDFLERNKMLNTSKAVADVQA